jgi:hypothetical protein
MGAAAASEEDRESECQSTRGGAWADTGYTIERSLDKAFAPNRTQVLTAFRVITVLLFERLTLEGCFLIQLTNS